jgi:hypothetical protein
LPAYPLIIVKAICLSRISLLPVFPRYGARRPARYGLWVSALPTRVQLWATFRTGIHAAQIKTRQLPGFVGYYLIDAGGGVIASVSVFENQTGADESVQQAAEWVKSMTDLVPDPPQITAGEVRISEERR